MSEPLEARVAAALAKLWMKNSVHFGGCITREPHSQGQACDCGFAELDAIREELGVPSDGFVRECIRLREEEKRPHRGLFGARP